MEKITKEEIKKLMKIPGKVRGVVFLTGLEYIRGKKGEKGVELVKRKIREWGCPIDFKKIRATEWYPIGWRVISLLSIKEVFNFGNKEIEDMGNCAPSHSFVVKMLMKYFLSMERTFKESPKYWQKHYTVGVLETGEFDKKKKYLTLRLKDFKIHPILCIYLKGYFRRIGQLSLKSEKVTNVETKCQFSGNSYHEFLMRWK